MYPPAHPSVRPSFVPSLLQYLDEYIVAMAHAGKHFKAVADAAMAAALMTAPGAGAPHAAAGAASPDRGRFYVVTLDEAEALRPELAGCAISAWAITLHDRLLAHPLRTAVASEARFAVAPPHFGWELHWPVPDGNRRLNSARPDAHFPLPEEGAGYEPYGRSIATSCATHYSPCGYEGCLPQHGATALGGLLRNGSALSQEGVLSLLGELFASLRLRRGAQRLLFYNGGPPGPVAYAGQEDRGGYDLPERAYGDERFAFALVNSVAPRFRPGVDVSLPAPWTKHLFNVREHTTRRGGGGGAAAPRWRHLLTFMGSFNTSRPHGNVRERAFRALHDPAAGVVVVDTDDHAQAAAHSYGDLLSDTAFTLVMRGDRPYSRRFCDAVCSGVVPVLLLSDGWVVPFSQARARPRVRQHQHQHQQRGCACAGGGEGGWADEERGHYWVAHHCAYLLPVTRLPPSLPFPSPPAQLMPFDEYGVAFTEEDLPTMVATLRARRSCRGPRRGLLPQWPRRNAQNRS